MTQETIDKLDALRNNLSLIQNELKFIVKSERILKDAHEEEDRYGFRMTLNYGRMQVAEISVPRAKVEEELHAYRNKILKEEERIKHAIELL